ncbi:MAG: AAA family ATPase, partial [Deltaproteobacteria bacterium]|nr:AAA family ATPase [Deltaproteobacteria bacterium]
MLQDLPVGTQTFEEVRTKNAVYVDKTNYFPLLPKGRKVVFCARPRRFGKSLTISALEAFFSGRKELFQGLAVEKYMNSPEFFPKPVIHLDMSELDNCVSLENLETKARNYLKKIAKQYNVPLQSDDVASAFSNLLTDVHDITSQKIVLLIDEYDTPVISLIQRNLTYDHLLIEQTRNFMSSFYSKIKSNDQYLDFIFITGVSKFSRMGVFSTLNNLVDISTNPEFASFMGLTQEELERDFAPYVKATAEWLQMEERELLERIRGYYDGFSFDGVTRVYNPFS